ncbi:hypothetical protein [Streptococcus suis]|nr:hypothetical protein [Streptococcus suis]MBM7192223.1 hypothetical protein [Streptococcus suis]MCO8224637.1 hypothetical protein [Streptococcus suis]
MKRTYFVSTQSGDRLLEVGDEANEVRVNNSKRLSFSEKMMLFGVKD